MVPQNEVFVDHFKGVGRPCAPQHYLRDTTGLLHCNIKLEEEVVANPDLDHVGEAAVAKALDDVEVAEPKIRSVQNLAAALYAKPGSV